MHYLALEEGWAPLAWFAPASAGMRAEAKKQLKGRGTGVTPPTPADESEWDAIRQETLRALRKGHNAQMILPAGMGQADGQDILTVHADARLINTVARRRPDGNGWEIRFVDFGWSGIQEHSR